MKVNFLLILVFIAFTFLAFNNGNNGHDQILIIGATELNGQGCVCHNLKSSPRVKVWVEGPDTLQVGETGLYKMFLTGGPAEAGGYNVAGRFGRMIAIDSLSKWDYRAPNELTQTIPLVFPAVNDTIYWEFKYTASDSSDVDTIYSCGLSIVYDSIPDTKDLWAFGPKFPLTIIEQDPTKVDGNLMVKDFSLEQNFPNPFNPSTKINYNLAKAGFVNLTVYDILGNEIKTLVNEDKPAGKYNVRFNAVDLSSGIYLYKLTAENFVQTKKMILTK